MNLRSVLMLRGAISVLLALYLVVAASSRPDSLNGLNGIFSILDGVLGMLLWFTLSRHPQGRWLSGLAFADATVRLVVGLTAFAYPSLQTRVLGSVVFFGAMIIACVVLGAVGVIYVLTMRRGGVREGKRGGALPALIVSVCTLLFGLGLYFGLSTEDGRRSLAAALAGAVGLTYLVTGVLMKRSA